jgi:hypothetical protein
VLAAPTQRGRHYAEHEVLELHSAGVLPQWRRQGIFAALIGNVLARLVPVVATVSSRNRAGVAERLARLGFGPAAISESEHRLRWEPGRS